MVGVVLGELLWIGGLAGLLAALGADVTEPGPFRLLSWDEAHELTRAAEVTLYPHTSTHPILSRCSDDKVEREVSEKHIPEGSADRMRRNPAQPFE